MNNTIIFLSLLIVFLSIMLVFQINIIFDLYGNFIDITIRLFGIKLATISISLIGLYIQINNKKKLKTLSVVFDKNNEYLAMEIKKNILDKLYFDDIRLFSRLGVVNSSSSVLFVSILNNICFFAKNKLKYSNKDLSFSYLNTVDFLNDNIIFNLNIKVYFTLFDLLFSIILSFYRRNKYVKKRKNRKVSNR
ncbi:MAG TPA: hypothetical protein DD614_03345 [Clostridiales bacterium]|nr:hypothetical protein [Clostridiales bacterium]